MTFWTHYHPHLRVVVVPWNDSVDRPEMSCWVKSRNCLVILKMKRRDVNCWPGIYNKVCKRTWIGDVYHRNGVKTFHPTAAMLVRPMPP